MPRTLRLRRGLQALLLGIEMVLRRELRTLRLGIGGMLGRGLRALRLGFAMTLRRGFRASRLDTVSMIFIRLASDVWALHLMTCLQ